ncbi:Coatomer beta subunit [Parasponia andersonii]|uniref:Coatomer beta subunit n=1 Tax=Parasponia andersonii TaxID=3476 RepID=A0A2P5DHG2_PARAD|nr:Coatomer beta subunit [Parasponia andersonii]
MERNSAADAMQWSIDLEKGIRSKAPGRSAEAILELGPRLQRWSLEPEPTPAAHHLFDLIPGEDRLFANAILLRLADAFASGDEHTKLCVVKVFLMEYRGRDKRKGKRYKGLLSKARVRNHLELLSRVKVVFDNGDANSRALALALFGCWADFAKDSAHIRYLVLSSLVSSHVLEAKAALFAAGCFCEFSDDFPCILLEMLVSLMTSTETLLPIRLAAARVYAKMGYSFSTATRAYKTGLKLVLDSSDENYQIAMLVSLSKIASTLAILMPDQVGFLFLFLNQEKRLRETALKCLRFMFSKGVCHISANADLVKALVSTLDEPLVPASIQCEALKILHKMVLHMLPSLPGDLLDLAKLLTVFENASVSPFMSKSLLGIRVLVDISNKFRGDRYIGSKWSCPPPLPSQVVPLIVDRITFQVKSLFDICVSNSVVFQEVNNLLKLLLSITREHPDSGVMVLDQIFVFLRYLSSMNDKVTATALVDTLVNENADNKGERNKVSRLKLACKVHRFIGTYLENLSEESGAITQLVFDKVKLLIEHVCECKFFDCYTQAIFSLLLHSPVIWGHNTNKTEESFNLDERSRKLLYNYSVDRELITLEFAKKILAENRNWLAYKVGMYSACQGAWFTSTFIFQQLIMRVHSDSCCRWLKSLFQFSQSEAKVMLLLLTKEDSSFTDQLEKIRPYIVFICSDLGEIGHDGTNSFYERNYGKVLLSAYGSVSSSKETLEFDVTSGQAFSFQRWFLALRAKALQAVVDVLKILSAIPFGWENSNNNEQVQESSVVECLLSLEQIAQVSLRLKRLTEEFDLFSASFMDIDIKSSNTISGLALSTSLLAFITGLFLFVPNLPHTCLKISSSSLRADLIQNLAARLWHIDHEISTKLYQIINANEHANKEFCNLKSRNQAFNFGCGARDVLNVCRYAITDMACLRSETDGTLKEENTYRVIKIALQLTFKILIKWMEIPFGTPKYFFRVRPCIGSELFVVNVAAKNSDGIFVLAGHYLSLSLCLQLRNVPPDLPVRPIKLYSMLYCRVSFQEPTPVPEKKYQSRSSYQAWESDNMVEMNEKLLRYVTQQGTKDINNSKCGSGNTDHQFVNTFVCFEPNQRGQGFSSCLLDVSRFPVGSYRITWISCCVDNHGNYWSLLPLNAGPIFTIC